MCLMTALALMASAAACGNSTETIGPTAPSEDSQEDFWMSDTDDGASDDGPINMEELVVQDPVSEDSAQDSVEENAENSAADSAQDSEDSSTQSESSAAESKTDSSQADNSSKTESTSSSKTEQESSKSEESASTSSAAESVAETAAPTEAPTEAATEDAENVVAGIVQLNGSSATCEGSGVTVEGNKVYITGEGTYVIAGTLNDGYIEVNTKLKVKLKLNGVDITNSSGPAIMITDAKRLTITLIEGTTNNLEDGTSTVYDGALFSNDTIEIKGAGTLNITGNNAHGIASDDDIVINNGNININAAKSGMMANDDISVSGGKLNIVGGTNGMKSKGTLHISGGEIWTVGGPVDTKSALHSETTFHLTGGRVYAFGCGVSEPTAEYSTQNAVMVKLTPSLTAGNTFSMMLGGTKLCERAPEYAYNTVFISTPELTDGTSCTVSVNGNELGSVTVSGLYTAVAMET